MIETKDIYPGMNWEEFKLFCAEQGFEETYKSDYVLNAKLNEELILINPDNGLVIYATSFASVGKNSLIVNSANLYAEIKPIKSKDIDEDILSDYKYSETKSGTISIVSSVKDGIFPKINKLGGSFEFVSPWTETPDLWFINPIEEREIGIKYGIDKRVKAKADIINKVKINTMSEQVRQIIGVQTGIGETGRKNK